MSDFLGGSFRGGGGACSVLCGICMTSDCFTTVCLYKLPSGDSGEESVRLLLDERGVAPSTVSRVPLALVRRRRELVVAVFAGVRPGVSVARGAEAARRRRAEAGPALPPITPFRP